MYFLYISLHPVQLNKNEHNIKAAIQSSLKILHKSKICPRVLQSWKGENGCKMR